MPDPVSTTPPAGRQPSVSCLMLHLETAHATVAPIQGYTSVSATFGTVDASFELLDEPRLVRQLLTDALAQLDAIETTR